MNDRPLSGKFPLAISQLSKSFGKNQVLTDTTLQLPPRSITGLLGRNAAGKTTLIRTAVGLLKPTAGSVKLFDQEAWDCTNIVRQKIGYVPQQFSDLQWLTTSEAIELVSSFYEQWDMQLINQYLHEWSVPLDQKIEKLSHGQRQKVGILLAIGHRPELLILDEPVASLDPVARHEFLRALLKMNDELQQTILFSSHITTDIERVAADVAILHEGEIIFHGGVDELKERVQCLFLRANELPNVNEVIEGVISSRIDGDRLQVWVQDWNEEKHQKLSDLVGIPVHSERVGLEELFMGMTS